MHLRHLSPAAAVAALCLAVVACSPLAGCNTTGSPAPASGTVATVQLDVAKGQIAARALQSQVDAAIIKLHSTGALTGLRFNNVKALALKGDSYLDQADAAVATGNAVLASSLVKQAVDVLAQAQASGAK